MTRAHIADPDILVKTLSGRPEDVRPCIGCNQGCVGGLMEFGRMGCTVNPAVGSEVRMGEEKLAPVTTPRSILVVGGGPAGMEAARVAAFRGHKVTLMEAAQRLGGTVKLARKAPHRAGIDDITVWLEEQVFKLGVDVRLSTYAEVDEVLAEKPDAVIVATGSSPRMDGRQWGNSGEPAVGMDSRIVMSSLELFEAPPAHAPASARWLWTMWCWRRPKTEPLLRVVPTKN
ncbi:MAG: FAD-dependent oxidoreductase [Burkholderiaceae bacterium]|nr:FAD-dependent oxidoreductase [Burkholderiaceae bacterium]